LQVRKVPFGTLVRFTKLVSDSSSVENIFSVLGQTVVETGHASHALVFGTTETGEFKLLTSHGGCDPVRLGRIDLQGVGSLSELTLAVTSACDYADYAMRAIPLISEAGLFGALIVVYAKSQPLDDTQWTLVEGLTELTAISLNKAYQRQRLQKAYDDLRASQETLVRTEKLRALGEMSAGIAHDVKNLLSPLLLYNDEIRDVAGNRDEVLELTALIERVLERGLATVERLRDFSRQSPETDEDQTVDLNSLVREAVEISKPKAGRIQFVLNLRELPAVRLRASECVTAIVNLIFNAADALQGTGAITMRTGEIDGGAFVEVEDDGPGIPPEVKGRILEPFFTTKGDRGTGLGVPLVYAFTQRYGGRLDIESEVGQGARFRMWFPKL
jgi:signal transduction histidine kinase